VCGAFGTFAHQAYTACLRGQLSSNVRPRNPLTLHAKRFEYAARPPGAAPRVGRATKARATAVPFGPSGKRSKPMTGQALCKLNRSSQSGSRSLTPRKLRSSGGGHASRSCTPGQGAERPARVSSSGAAAGEYGSRYWLHFAPAPANSRSMDIERPYRSAETGSARRVLGKSPTAGLPLARPNPSLELTRYGRRCSASAAHGASSRTRAYSACSAGSLA
jgi:hypothetical protein